MSILEIPRIYFSGEISWDPVTTNNYPKNYNEKACETIFTKGNDVTAFRQSAIDQVATDGNWNPDGSYRSTYFNTYVSGVDTGSGLKIDDPFIKAPVNFSGMLVDSEPYGALSSQLFFDDISFGIEGGCRIYGKRFTRFHDRYINFAQNPANNMIAGVASVMWQTCFPKEEGLVIDAHDSPALLALKASMDDDDVLGIMVRWDSYRTVYYDDETLSNGSPITQQASKVLQKKLNGGGFQPNPARSLVVGSVGLWRRGDPIHEAGNRTLVTSGDPVNIAQAVAGTAFALVSENRITLDLSNCIPDATRAPEKVNLGDLTLSAADPDPAIAIMKVATIPYSQYNYTAYQATSGIVEIPISKAIADSLATMDLKLTSEIGNLNLTEAVLRAIPSDPNLYMNQGETITTTVQVYERGKIAGPDIKVTMASINDKYAVANTQTTDYDGIANFTLTGTSGSVTGYALLPGDKPSVPVNNFNALIDTYMYVRVLPEDADIAAFDPTWENVQDYVLGNWQAMAPCMDNWLDLGDPEQVKSYGKIIKKLTDPANFEAYRYMPVTRDMTAGQRTLLNNFLDGKVKSELLMNSNKTAGNSAIAVDNYALSKSLRSPNKN